MDIKISSLDEWVVARFDSLAKQSGRSRNEVMKAALENAATPEHVRMTERSYEELVRRLEKLIADNTAALREVVRIVEDEE